MIIERITMKFYLIYGLISAFILMQMTNTRKRIRPEADISTDVVDAEHSLIKMQKPCTNGRKWWS
jgi:hypothetical protein